MRHISILVLVAATAAFAQVAQPMFRISQYNDLATCADLAWNMTANASVCTNLTTSSSNWHCPPRATKSWLQYASWNPSETGCSGPPTEMHWNFCGECKANMSRQCSDDGKKVTIVQCNDQFCSHGCVPVAELYQDQCNTNVPLPMTAGQYVQLIKVHPKGSVQEMYHQWWDHNEACQAVPHHEHGWDLIALGKCNNGWVFECLST